MKDTAGLTGRRRAFVLAFVQNPDATAAARSAGYSQHTANQIGNRLLCVPAVRDEISRLTSAALAKAELSIDQTLEQLRRLVSFRLQDIFDAHNAIKPVAQWPAEAESALVGIETREMLDEEGNLVGQVRKVRMSPRIDAIDRAMRYFGLLIERHEIHQTVEHKIADMTPEQRQQRAAEILTKVQSLLPPAAEAPIDAP